MFFVASHSGKTGISCLKSSENRNYLVQQTNTPVLHIIVLSNYWNLSDNTLNQHTGWVLLLVLPRVLELASLPNRKAELESPSINSWLGYGIRQRPQKRVGPVRGAPRFVPNPTQSCTSISIRWWHKEGRPFDWCHFCCNVQRYLENENECYWCIIFLDNCI